MANTIKFLTKNGLKTQNIDFSSPTEVNTIQVKMLDGGILIFTGVSGQLFSISDSLTGTIFAVNDISGVPSIEVDDTGVIRFAQYSGNVLFGTAVDNGVDKVQVNGTVSAISYSSTVATGTAPFTISSTTKVTNLYADRAALADNFSTTRGNYLGVTNSAVAGELMWKIYGNGHTIFDASAGTTPTGVSCSNSTPDIPWQGSFPTLMGYNGENTYGVRVDRATLADNSNLVDGYAPSVVVSNNTLVLRNASGYVFGNYFNMTANVSATAASHIAIQNSSDNYLRWQTPAQFIANHGIAPLTGVGTSGTWPIAITGNAATATTAGTTTGNAATATKLATARAINGVNFDGSAPITIYDTTKAPLTGEGTSGTWGISVTGNAATATTATNVAWSGVTGKPAVIAAGADATTARSAIGAGTSNLAIGVTGSTAMAGNTAVQAPLVSGTNIKTINGNALLGSGDVAVGYLNIPQNSQSAAYTLVLDDAGKHIFHPSADTSARTFTIPANASVAYPIGTAITFVNQNGMGGVVSIAITSDTMRLAGAGTTGTRTLARNGVATAIKITTTEWIISGTGLT